MNSVYFLVALALISLPLGWYEGVDGSFNDFQNGPLNKKMPMLYISLEPASARNPADEVNVRAKIYNNTESTISVVEVGVMARDFDFEIKDVNGGIEAPNNLFQRIGIIRTQCAWHAR